MGKLLFHSHLNLYAGANTLVVIFIVVYIICLYVDDLVEVYILKDTPIDRDSNIKS